MSQSEGVGVTVAVEKVMEKKQENFSDTPDQLRKTRHHILAAQFECYLKIIHDPPRTEEGGKTASIVLLVLYSQFN